MKPHSLFPRAVLSSLLFSSALVGSSNAADSTWSGTANGNFSDPLNWSAGVPGATSGSTNTDVATLPRTANTSARTINFDTAYNLGGVTFNNNAANAFNYNLSNTTIGLATPNLTLTSGGIIQNTGASAATNNNLIDVNLVLSGSSSILSSSGNTILNVGISSGASANTITTATGLGNIDLTLGGTSTGSNLQAMRINQGTGTTLRLVKDGPGFWQINGPSTGGSGLTGGFFLKQGAVSIGRNSGASLGTGPVTIGDSAGTTDLRLAFGSSVTISNPVTVKSTTGGTVTLERGGGSGGGTFSGGITLERDIIVRQASTATQTLAFSTVGITGTGNISIASSVASAGAINFNSSVNMTGSLSNNSTLATGMVTVGGAIGSNVTGVTQNSATSNMTLSSASNAYTGATTISAGSLLLSGGGTLGNSNLVLGGGTLNITGTTTGLTMASARTISGTGTIITTGKTFTHNGTFAPGSSAGEVTVTGDFTLGTTASSQMELAGTGGVAGTDFDRLNVSGALTLDGALAVTGYNGFSLDTPGTYDLFSAGSFSNNFDSVLIGATPLIFATDWTGNNGTSSFVFDVSTGDLTISAIPEPSTGMLLLLTLGAQLLLRRRNRQAA